MKNMRIIFFTGIVLFAFSCKKNEKQKADVSLNFQTVFSGADYSFLNEFTNGDGIKIRLELLQFYISNVRFVKKNGREVLAEDIALVKCDLNGSGIADIKIPAGDYTSLRFGIGVPKEMNESDPSEFNEPDHPLNVTQNTYWGMNAMYRFLMLDGRYDIEGDGIMDGVFSYHTGYNESYREVELIHDFSFDRKGNYSQIISIDVSKLFYVPGNIVDVVNESDFHGELTALDIALRMSDNFAASLSIQ